MSGSSNPQFFCAVSFQLCHFFQHPDNMSDQWASFSSDWQSQSWDSNWSHHPWQQDKHWQSEHWQSQAPSQSSNQWGQRSNPNPTAAPKTPPKRVSGATDMQLSPRGTLPNKVATLPVQWKPDCDHYDTQESFRLRFPRQIKNTAWSSRNNLAGRDPLSIPVAE